MRIVIISVGKKHDASLVSAISDYEERISRVAKLSWHYIEPSGKSGDTARTEESKKILAVCKPLDVLWLLDEAGMQISSPQLAERLETAQNSSITQVNIVIGGAYGVDDTVRNQANFVWSLSALVFPHQLVRLILVEQLYRAYEINRGSGYHHI